MKIIQYHLCTIIPVEGGKREKLFAVELPWSENNEKLAQSEAYRGEYTVTEREEVGA